jgi:hypothetical protein
VGWARIEDKSLGSRRSWGRVSLQEVYLLSPPPPASIPLVVTTLSLPRSSALLPYLGYDANRCVMDGYEADKKATCPNK